MYGVAGTIDHTYRHVNGTIPNGKFWSPEWEFSGDFPAREIFQNRETGGGGPRVWG